MNPVLATQGKTAPVRRSEETRRRCKRQRVTSERRQSMCAARGVPELQPSPGLHRLLGSARLEPPTELVRTFTATLLADTGCGLGESPFWDPRTRTVTWLDIDASRLLRFPDGSKVDSSFLPTESTFVALADDGGLIAAHPTGVDLIEGTGANRRLVPAWLDPAVARTNDGAVDPMGRIWVGSTRRDRRVGSGGIGVVTSAGWEERFSDLTLPNGIAWSPAGDVMYYVDTLTGTLWQAAFDMATATVGISEALFEMPTSDGLIDGICVDITGGIWMAVWGGSVVLRIDSAGHLIGRVSVAAPKVTSCAFGDTTLYITSADPDGTDPPGSGGLFAVDVGVEGVPVAPALVSG